MVGESRRQTKMLEEDNGGASDRGGDEEVWEVM